VNASRYALASCPSVTAASSGVYEDKGLPALQDWLGRAVCNPIEWVPRLIADERNVIADTLRDLVDKPVAIWC
jgi:molybdopterin biosynthesis enzyme MoaB